MDSSIDQKIYVILKYLYEDGMSKGKDRLVYIDVISKKTGINIKELKVPIDVLADENKVYIKFGLNGNYWVMIKPAGKRYFENYLKEIGY